MDSFSSTKPVVSSSVAIDDAIDSQTKFTTSNGSSNRKSPSYGGITGNLILASFASSLGSFGFGYNLGSLNAVLVRLQTCPRKLPHAWSTPMKLSCFQASQSELGTASSLLCLGALLGCLGSGHIVNRLGRKPTIFLSALMFFIGLVVLCLAMNVPMLMVGRVFVGLGIGATCVATPLYLTEIAPQQWRGIFGSLHQMSIVIGYLVSMILGLIMISFDPEDVNYWNWRIVLGLNLITVILQIILMAMCPESPKYLATTTSDRSHVRAALKWFRKSTFDEHELEELITTEEEGLNNANTNINTKDPTTTNILRNRDKDHFHPSSPIERKKEKSSLWSLLRRRPDTHKSLWYVVLLHLAQQLSCVNGIFYFSTAIFSATTKSGFATYVPLTIAIINVLMTFVSLTLIDKAGRRPLLLGSCGGMIVGLTLYTLAALLISPMAANSSLVVMKAISVFLFVASFAIGMGPIPWLMMGELFDSDSVGSGIMLGVSVNWIGNFSVVAMFPLLVNWLDGWVFAPFLIFLLGFTTWAAIYLPETKGRPAALL